MDGHPSSLRVRSTSARRISKRAGNSSLPGGGQAVGIGASAQHGAGSQADRFDDVGAATNASVHQDFDLTVHCRDDFGQSSQRRANSVELASAVIGNDHGGSAFIHRAARVFAGENALDDDRTGPVTCGSSSGLPRSPRRGPGRH